VIRLLLTWWRGPLCDAGTALGQRGCLKAAVAETVPHPPGWTRGFRWCEEHRGDAGQAIGLGPRRSSGKGEG
jgi:hypothetical protein